MRTTDAYALCNQPLQIGKLVMDSNSYPVIRKNGHDYVKRQFKKIDKVWLITEYGPFELISGKTIMGGCFTAFVTFKDRSWIFFDETNEIITNVKSPVVEAYDDFSEEQLSLF